MSERVKLVSLREQGATRAPGAVCTRRRRRALWVASVLGGLGQSLAGSAGALLAAQIGGSDLVAGLPQTLLVAGSAMSALALSRLTRTHGRGTALLVGLSVGALGAVIVMGAAQAGSLTLVALGSLLLGAGNTAVMLGRYAAADLGPPDSRARSMGTVLTAVTVGAVAGPNLLAPTSVLSELAGLPALGGPYAVAAAAFGSAGVVLRAGWTTQARVSVADDPDTGPSPAADRTRDAVQPNQTRSTQRSLLPGLAVLGVANLVMVAVMTMAPVQLHHHGTRLGAIGLVISIHIADMYAPSPVSGWLTDHAGPAATATLGCTSLIAACLLAAATNSQASLLLAMAILGVGWNLRLLSGSALLIRGVDAAARPAEKAGARPVWGWPDPSAAPAQARSWPPTATAPWLPTERRSPHSHYPQPSVPVIIDHATPEVAKRR